MDAGKGIYNTTSMIVRKTMMEHNYDNLGNLFTSWISSKTRLPQHILRLAVVGGKTYSPKKLSQSFPSLTSSTSSRCKSFPRDLKVTFTRVSFAVSINTFKRSSCLGLLIKSCPGSELGLLPHLAWRHTVTS